MHVAFSRRGTHATTAGPWCSGGTSRKAFSQRQHCNWPAETSDRRTPHQSHQTSEGTWHQGTSRWCRWVVHTQSSRGWAVQIGVVATSALSAFQMDTGPVNALKERPGLLEAEAGAVTKLLWGWENSACEFKMRRARANSDNWTEVWQFEWWFVNDV